MAAIGGRSGPSASDPTAAIHQALPIARKRTSYHQVKGPDAAEIPAAIFNQVLRFTALCRALQRKAVGVLRVGGLSVRQWNAQPWVPKSKPSGLAPGMGAIVVMRHHIIKPRPI